MTSVLWILAVLMGLQAGDLVKQFVKPRAILKVAVANDDKNAPILKFTLTNTSKELWACRWMNDELESLCIVVHDSAKNKINTSRHFVGAPLLKMTKDGKQLATNFLVLKPGESYSELIAFSSFFNGNPLPPGKYSVDAIFSNHYMEEIYLSRRIEVTLIAK